MNPNNYLIITICNHGYADQVMDVAKKAGARGGTIMRARGSVGKNAEKFFGITIQPEKDVVLIVIDEQKKANCMHAICSQLGPHTPTHAITFSLLVDEVVGINL